MTFEDFVDNLSKEDRENYDEYSEIRGVLQYRIIFETLHRICEEVKYSDVNAFVRYDKAIKDVLYKYLAIVEEKIRNEILSKFDFDSAVGLKDKYEKFDRYFPKFKIIESDNGKSEITELYKRYALTFRNTVLFAKKYMKTEYNYKELDVVVNLRNEVMHHSLLLFNYDLGSTCEKTRKSIETLRNVLPDRYRKGLIEGLKSINDKAKENIAPTYFNLLLY